MELPGHGLVGGEWDLRGGEEAYLGGVSFRGKQVLELGTASGFLCHYMERQGADVIGFDLSQEHSWDLVPFAGLDIASFRTRMRAHIECLKNGWWLAHRLFGSRARVVYGTVYDIPGAIGPVDVATFGAILLHLRDPFGALHSALRLTRETAIVTEVHPEQPADSSLAAAVSPEPPPGRRGFWQRLLSPPAAAVKREPKGLYFLPDPRAVDPSAAVTWWCFPPEVIGRFLAVLGFADQTVTEHSQTFLGKKARMYTVVARRTRAAAAAAA
jgi:hypothetical protein